jgi:hypothetical protein
MAFDKKEDSPREVVQNILKGTKESIRGLNNKKAFYLSQVAAIQAPAYVSDRIADEKKIWETFLLDQKNKLNAHKANYIKTTTDNKDILKEVSVLDSKDLQAAITEIDTTLAEIEAEILALQ